MSSLSTADSPAIETVSPAPEKPDRREGGVTIRVVLFSLALAAFFGYVIPIIDIKFRNTQLGGNYLPPGAVAVLLVLLLVLNPLLNLLRKRWMLSRNEMLTIYITTLFSVLVPGRGNENFFIPSMIASFYMATPENAWLSFLQPYVKPWLTPALDASGKYNPDAITGFYTGGPIPWEAWLTPMLIWGALIFTVYVMLGCLGVMLRAQWSDREALAFPLLRLPLEMTEDVDHPEQHGVLGRFFKSPLMWVGLAIPVFIHTMNGLNVYFPDVPRFPLQISTGGMFSEAPFNQLGPFTFLVFPMVIGVSYLLTSEVGFSFWFFYLFVKLQLIVAYYIGFPPATLPDPTWTRGWAESFIAFQQIGAMLTYIGFIMWLGREHYVHVFKRAVGRAPRGEGEHREPLSYPLAFWGFILCLTFIIGWTVMAGVRLDLAILFWLLYIIVAIALSRIVVEGGLLMVFPGWAPLGPLAYLFGAGAKGFITTASAVPMAMIGGALITDPRGILLPAFVQSFKLAHDRRISMKPLLALIFCATFLASTVGWWTIVRLGYNVGALQLEDWWTKGFGAVQTAANTQEVVRGIDMSLTYWLWLLIGGAMTWGMMVARTRLLWFPLHPIGLLMAWPTAMYNLWFSIFLGWLAKRLITKYAGTESYRATTPLFLGLILGDVLMMAFWVGIDSWQGHTGHKLMP